MVTGINLNTNAGTWGGNRRCWIREMIKEVNIFTRAELEIWLWHLHFATDLNYFKEQGQIPRFVGVFYGHDSLVGLPNTGWFFTRRWDEGENCKQFSPSNFCVANYWQSAQKVLQQNWWCCEAQNWNPTGDLERAGNCLWSHGVRCLIYNK